MLFLSLKTNSSHLFWQGVVRAIEVMTFLAGAALAAMILATCADVILRAVGAPLKGVYDLIRIFGALTAACALPLTTALKGHVAIEYFFQRLPKAGRLAVDTLMRLIVVLFFAGATYACVRYGIRFLRSGEVSATLEVPVFWVPWVMAAAMANTGLVVCFHLLHPGQGMIKP